MDRFLGMSATTWTGIYTIITLGLLVGAAVAVWYAKKQWATAREQAADARRAQLEASRPYVIVTVEPSPTTRHLFDLVVKNIGQRPAFSVSIKLNPAPVRANEKSGHEIAKAKMLNKPISMIAPAQELRAYYDSHIEREGREDVPSSHQVTLTYQDSSEREYSEAGVLDLEAMSGVMYVEARTIHDIAKALDEIRKTLSRASLLNRKGSVQVDASIEWREEMRQRLAEQRAERMKQYGDIVAKVRPPTSDEESEATLDENSARDDSD